MAVYLQNVPQFLIAQIGTWKAGGIAVSVNPMNREPTGPPKGAMTTHRNVVFNAQTYRDWIGIGHRDVILGVAPLFHITGLVGHVAISLLAGVPLVLMYRLDPALTIETIQAEQATFTVGSITVFIALMNAPNASREALASLRKVYSGGAPIRPARSRRSKPRSDTTSTTSTASPRPPRPRTPYRSARRPRWTMPPGPCRSAS